MDLGSDKGILAALANPNLAVRAMAMAKIHEIGGARAIEILTPAATQKEDPILRARALWQMGKLKHLRFINAAFADPDPRFRVLAMRILFDTHKIDPTQYDDTQWAGLLRDDSAHVRREALLMLQDVEPAKAAPLFYKLAQKYDGKDRFYLAALGIAAGNTDAKRREAMLAGFAKHFSEWNETLPSLLWELRPADALTILEPKLFDAKLDPNQRAQIVDVLADINEPKVGKVILSVLRTNPPEEVQARILTRLREGLAGPFKSLKGSKEVAEVIDNLMKDPKTRLIGLNLIALEGNAAHQEEIIKLARGEKENLMLRVVAVHALGSIAKEDTWNVLLALAGDEKQPLPLRVEAIQVLGRDWTWLSKKDLLNLITPDETKTQRELRQAVLASVAGHKVGAEYLLKHFQEKGLAADLTSDLSRLLRNSPFPEVKKKAQALLPAPPKFDPKNLPSIPALLARKGNVERGRQVYLASFKNEVQCMKCHRVSGEGGNVGPDLSAIGSKESREKLLESILYPDRAINHHYVTWVVEDLGGRIIQGIIAEEQPDFIVMRDATTKEYKVGTKDLADKRKVEKSIMPDNLMLFLSEDDLIDLVEYLYSLKSTLAPTARLERSGEALARLQARS